MNAIGVGAILMLGYLALRGQLRVGRFLRRRGMKQLRDGVEHLTNGCLAYVVAALVLLAVLGLIGMLIGT
jgi:hypothetical protein